MHFAARGGCEELCKYMVDKLKLSVDARDNDGDTPLIHAARQGHTSFSLYLLEHGADACATPSENQPSVLHHAAGTGSMELIKALVAKELMSIPQVTPVLLSSGPQAMIILKQSKSSLKVVLIYR